MKINTIKLGGGSIRFVDEGVGVPLLFIHGWGITPITYQESIEALSVDFRVIAPFFRDTKSFGQAAKRAIELMDSLNIDSFVVVGHSSAGITATLIAHDFPSKTKALILIDSMGIINDHTFAQWLFIWLRHVSAQIIPTKKHDLRFLFRLSKDFFSQVLRYPKTLWEEAMSALNFNVISLLKEVRVPILILWGKEDDLTSLQEGNLLVQANNKIVFEVVSGGHDWIKVNSNELVLKISDFLKNNK